MEANNNLDFCQDTERLLAVHEFGSFLNPETFSSPDFRSKLASISKASEQNDAYNGLHRMMVIGDTVGPVKRRIELMLRHGIDQQIAAVY